MSSRSRFHITRRLRIGLSLLLAVAALALALQTNPSAHAASHAMDAMQMGQASSTAPTTNGDVSIVNFAFEPNIVTITEGSSVQWTNTTASVTHTTTSDIDLWSQILGPGDVFSRTFTTPGTYTYHCAIHPSMQGEVVVLIPVFLPLITRS